MCTLLLAYDEYIFIGFFIGFYLRGSFMNAPIFKAMNYDLRERHSKGDHLLLHFTFWWKKETREEFPAVARKMNICNFIHSSYLVLLVLFLVCWYTCMMCCR